MQQNNNHPEHGGTASTRQMPRWIVGQETESGITYFEATREQFLSSRAMQDDVPVHKTLLSGPQVARRLGLSPEDFIGMYAEEIFHFLHGFPAPVELVPGTCRWLEYEVDNYIDRQIFGQGTRYVLKVTDWEAFSDSVH